MLTMESTIREVYSHPVGKDLMNLLLNQLGKGPGLIDNPLVGSMRLKMASGLLGNKAPGLLEDILHLLNQQQEVAPPSPAQITHKWWKEAVVYQIYPRSFQDSNGDGIGDLQGIRQRIPYLKQLGVDVVWLSPIYDSPNDDMGYDIRDYRKIMAEFGNMDDFDAMLADLHANGMKLMMDIVVNHTSDEHEWFQKALKDPSSPTKDYYIWAKGKDGKEPNNWTSFFSGPAWNHYEANDEWALHLFSKKQMDLNWDNPALRHEVYDMMNWWLEKGVDGFRLDVINYISKDNLQNGNEMVGQVFGFCGIEHYVYGPHLHEYLAEMRRESFGKHDVFTVGETPGVGLEMARLLTAQERGELDLIFNFDHLENAGKTRQSDYEYDLRELKDYFLKWQQEYGNNCWPSIFFENHDNPRMPSKVRKDPAHAAIIAKLVAVMQFTLKGTPFLYQGQELGMTNCNFADIEEIRDVECINLYNKLCQTMDAKEGFEKAIVGTRDNARTPMQWSGAPNAEFTIGTPWIKLNPNYTAINAQQQLEDDASVLAFYKSLIGLRHEHQALVYGDFHPVFAKEKDIFCYFRILGDNKFYIEINLTGFAHKRRGPIAENHRLLAGNYGDVAAELRPYEANVYRCL